MFSVKMPQEGTEPPAAPRILEIGDASLMIAAFPETTEFYSTRDRADISAAIDPSYAASVLTFPRLLRRVVDRRYDLIVVHAPPNAPWTLRGINRSLFRRSLLGGRVQYIQSFAQQLIRLVDNTVPIAVVDFDDPPIIFRHNLFLLDRARYYFKRELPTDYWRLFMGTAHPRVPTPRFRAVPLYRRRLEKIRPISISFGWNFGLTSPPTIPWLKKSIDVFFSGRVIGSASVRERGLRELLALRAEGLNIFIPDKALPRSEYLEACARSYLVWSPEGFGWECFRTYEAALCRAVPLLSRQTIERYMPLIDGIHALYYDVEPGQLTHSVQQALRNRSRLLTIAAAAREHVLTYHTPAAIARHIAEITLSAPQCYTDGIPCTRDAI